MNYDQELSADDAYENPTGNEGDAGDNTPDYAVGGGNYAGQSQRGETSSHVTRMHDAFEGICLCMPKRNTPSTPQSNNFSELMQFMLVCAEAENRLERRCRGESEEIEERLFVKEKMQLRGTGMSVNNAKKGGNREWNP